MYNYLSIELPLESIGHITNLKAMDLREMPFVTNTHIPESFCNLKQLIFFDMTFMQYLDSFPYDCIAQEWQEIAYIKIEAIPAITYLPPTVWSLPNLQTVILDYSNYNTSYFTFDTFTKYTKTLTKVSLSGSSKMCNGSIIIDNERYTGFEYLGTNFTGQDVENHVLLQFIQQFDPCLFPCNVYTWV